jgi:hypothetical protein
MLKTTRLHHRGSQFYNQRSAGIGMRQEERAYETMPKYRGNILHI